MNVDVTPAYEQRIPRQAGKSPTRRWMRFAICAAIGLAELGTDGGAGRPTTLKADQIRGPNGHRPEIRAAATEHPWEDRQLPRGCGYGIRGSLQRDVLHEQRPPRPSRSMDNNGASSITSIVASASSAARHLHGQVGPGRQIKRLSGPVSRRAAGAKARLAREEGSGGWGPDRGAISPGGVP